jgi:hypothetical protein
MGGQPMMSIVLAGALLAAAFAIGIGVGRINGEWRHARLDQPPVAPGLLERMRIRRERRKHWDAKRAEFIRTGVIAPPRTKRVETW